MAKVKYNGPKNIKRVVGEYVFEAENNHIAEVGDAKMIKTLLAQPNGEFSLVTEVVEAAAFAPVEKKSKKWKEE